MSDKKLVSPGTLLNPVPVVLVSCGSGENKNLITIAWTGTINSDPPMVYISVRKNRHSHKLISESGAFVINLVNEEMAKAVDFCGVKSGRDIDKFKACGFTALDAERVTAPIVAESPLNIECLIKDTLEFPSHDMFIAEVVKVHADYALIDEKGRIRLDNAGLVAYNHGEYFGLKKKPIGKFGYSVMKPSTRRRINRENNTYRRRHRK